MYRNAMHLWTEQAERTAREKASKTPETGNKIDLSPTNKQKTFIAGGEASTT